MSVALRARQPPSKPHHGKFIYLYSNLKTHQVIYSLEREIHTEKQERILLKQLPFYAKKTVPTKLRKDLWRPYATVTFPDAADGLHAFKLLKEYRMVRDHSWTIAAPRAYDEQSVPATRAIANLAGAWPDKKDRAKLLMDQRATSVADLAHVIRRRMTPVEGPTARERQANIAREKLWAKIQALANTPEADIKKLEEEKGNLDAAVDIPTHKQNQQGHAEKAKQKKRLRRIKEITAQLNRLRKAREAVTFASGGDVEEKLRLKWSKTLKYIVQMQVPDRHVIEDYDMNKAQARKEAAAEARPTNWPKSTKYDDGVLGPKALTQRDRIALKSAKGNPEVDVRAQKELPEGSILIQWADLRDAQFAAAADWHPSVVHDEMDNKLALAAEKTRARIDLEEREAEEASWEDVGPEHVKRIPDGGKYRAQMESEKEKTGFLGSLNPMRLFKGSNSGEARP